MMCREEMLPGYYNAYEQKMIKIVMKMITENRIITLKERKSKKNAVAR